jgi:hypothetical protein
VIVELLGTAGLILLAARIYERAILRIGAPIKLRRLFASGSHQIQRGEGSARRDGPVRHLDVAGRIVAIALLLGGAAIGLGEPLSIAMILAGLLIIAALERCKRQPPRGAAR